MNVWSEQNKVVSGVIPVADAFATSATTDVINMENYNKCTFIIYTGATTTADGVVTVNAGNANDSCATAIAFKYRTQVAKTDATTQGGDVPSALTAATSAGFAMTASKVGGIYIIEVDSAVVAAAGTNFDHVSCTVTEDTDDPQTACILAILSEPRYPQAVLATAID